MPVSDRRAGEILRGLVHVLLRNPDGLRVEDVLREVAIEVLPLKPEMKRSAGSGVLRFNRIVHNRSKHARKAGWLSKGGGIWRVTEEGKDAYEKLQDPEEFWQEAMRRADEAPRKSEATSNANSGGGERGLVRVPATMTTKRLLQARLLYGIAQILAPHPEGMNGKEVIRLLQDRVELGDADELVGNLERLWTRVSFDAIALVRAGWMTRGKGTWGLTDAGRAAVAANQDPVEFLQEARALYLEWREGRSSSTRELEGRRHEVVELPDFPSELREVKPRTAALFQTHPWDLSLLLQMLDAGKIVLPEFQRSFVWKPADIDLLVTSLIQGYPAGTLLLLKVDSRNALASRPVEEVELESPAVLADYLVLDGQQRLTSLSLALNGRGDHLFFINLIRLLDDDVEAALFPTRRTEVRRRGLFEQEVQLGQSLYPLSALMGSAPEPDWLVDWVDFHVQRGEDRTEMKARRRYIEQTYLEVLKSYRFPVVELPAETDLEAVCQIFETLNTTGLRLTVFDLLTARFWPLDLHLRDVFEKTQESYPLLGPSEFDVEPTFLLQAVSLLRSGVCKRGDLLNLERTGFEQDWERVCAGASEALGVLKGECGVLTRAWLPYGALFPALFAVAAEIRDLSGPLKGVAWEKLKQWFWCCAFGQRYEGPVNTLNAADFRHLRTWIHDDDAVPEAVESFALSQLDLRNVERQRNAIYRAVICLTILNGARDFFTSQRLTGDLLNDPNKRIEDHHIFPRAFLRREKLGGGHENSVLNRALIDQQTNRVISDNPPSLYLKEIEKVRKAALDTTLESHLLPTFRSSGLWSDDFEVFLGERETLILEAIANVTGADASAGLPDDTYLDPAQPFSNELAMRKLLRGLRGTVFWYEQHMSKKALELLSEEISREGVREILLLSGPANVNEKVEAHFSRFKREFEAQGIAARWRLLPDEIARQMHARVMFDDARGWEMPPLNSLLKGTVDSIRRSEIDRATFLSAWDHPGVRELAGAVSQG